MKNKVLKSPTYSMQISIANGERHSIAGTNYAGTNPVYTNGYKTSKGIPFVNLDKLDLS